MHAAFDLGRIARLKFSSPLYFSIDLDGLDPAYAPGVSHPEPGGLTVRQVLDVIGSVRAPAIVGGDVVELNPRLDPSGITAVVAAKLARELLARMIVETASPAGAPLDQPPEGFGSRPPLARQASTVG